MASADSNTGAAISRRHLLATAAVASAAFTPPHVRAESPAQPLKISIFSKHLRFLEGEDLAKGAAEIGFDGIDIAVRKGGHVEPQAVTRDLPKLVSIIRANGLKVPMITTDIVDDTTPFAEDILRSAAELGIYNYRWGGFKYSDEGSYTSQLSAMKPLAARLAALNNKYGACAMYHTHSGISVVGAPIWDLHILLQDFDPKSVAVNYDVGHATVEGGLGGWIDSFHITGPYLKGLAVKDFIWRKDSSGNWKVAWQPLGHYGSTVSPLVVKTRSSQECLEATGAFAVLSSASTLPPENSFGVIGRFL